MARAVAKFSGCWVNTTSWWGIKQRGISVGSIFLLFSYESSWGHSLSSWGKSPAPTSLMAALMAVELVTCISNIIMIVVWMDLDVELTCFE